MENNYNNGLPQQVNLDYKKEMAIDFSEGNKMLEKLLLTSWKKGIETYACCNGHTDNLEGPEKPYISFVFESEQDAIKFAVCLSCVFSNNKKIQIELVKRNFDRLFLNKHNKSEFLGQQISLTVRINAVIEDEKSSYYNDICNVIKHFDFSSQDNNLYKKFDNCVKTLLEDYNWLDFDDSYYLCINFCPPFLFKNIYRVTKYFNNNIHYFKFNKKEKIQKPVGMDDATALAFLKTQKRISAKNVGMHL